MTTRRGFLGLFGGAVLGGKKAVATTLQAGLDGLSPVSSGRGWWNTVEDDGAPDGFYPGDNRKEIDPTLLKVLGIPDWMKDGWRREAKYFSNFDPDIASLGSFSLSAKINLQRERNYARYEGDFWDRGEKTYIRRAWEKLNGHIGWY